jgi:Nickel responsive protein SCO4226-like
VVTFLAETYLPATTSSDEMERSASEAAATLTAEGTPIRFIRSILVPEDETCFFVFEAASPVTVQEVARRAGCGDARVSRAIERSQTEGGSR